jgi:small-conductance mechanosensitive channel
MEYFFNKAVYIWDHLTVSTKGVDGSGLQVLFSISLIYILLKKRTELIAFISNKLSSKRAERYKIWIEKLLLGLVGVIFLVTVLKIVNFPVDYFISLASSFVAEKLKIFWAEMLKSREGKEAMSIISNIEYVWHYALISVGGKEIRVSNLLLAISMTIIAIKQYSLLTSLIVNNLFSSQSVTNKTLIEKLFSILIGGVFLITILQIANIPLDTFAFLGGALALGVGLGVQNLINNILSSLIIVIEEPLRVGDFITINNSSGKVMHIGNRCVVINTTANATIFIPSSTILQGKLINWSKRHLVVSDIEVEVPKECDVDMVTETLTEILDTVSSLSHLKNPRVLLSGITISYYIFTLEYKANINCDIQLLVHQVSVEVLKKIGPNVIIKHRDAFLEN